MPLDTYQDDIAGFDVFVLGSQYHQEYLGLGLASEVGELLSLLKRELRDGIIADEPVLRNELGDILWYLTRLCSLRGFTLDEVAAANVTKLTDRQQRGVIHGTGDQR